MTASASAATARSVDVVTLPPDAAGVADGGMLPPAGSVVLCVGDAAASSWQQLREAALRGDWQALRDAPVPAPPAPGTRLVAASPLFDLLCAGHTVARDLALPHGCPFRTVTFPYTGGPIRDADFRIVEHPGRDVPAVATSYLLLRRAPELTPLERRLLESVGPDERHLHMGPREPCQTITTMNVITNNIAAAAQAAVDCKHGRGGCGMSESDTVLSEAEIEEITGGADGPAASVADLLATRRRHFSR
ncbi:hypothetical protein ACFOSC_08725 [Streptantibioticus rubrisoli]|uniref:Uncharacterized protein n=1 Tax=Streptantibioticus rubrisoli TaxID=1387313 RepID=A0ABT1P5X9_9ACTN|nr:hypothetical protein [Streptantibioticus rubrisoli]MCQ4040793.1 hypothetical protein [Streptantibioticus rubrisoli]